MALWRIALTSLAVLALLAVAPAAQADDASVFDAWTAENQSLATLEDRLEKNLRSWERSSFRKGEPAVETIGRIRKLIARRRKAVSAQEPSSSDGRDGKSLALANLRDYDSAMVKLKRAVESGMARRFGQADRYLGQYRELMRRAEKYEARANVQFSEAGVL